MPLNIAQKQRMFHLFVVCLGGFVGIAALVRCIRVSQVLAQNSQCKCASSTRANYPHNVEVLIKTQDFPDVAIWSNIEMQIGLFCISSPCTRPVLRQIFPRLMSSTTGASSGNHRARSRLPRSVYTHAHSSMEVERGQIGELGSKNYSQVSRTCCTILKNKLACTEGYPGKESQDVRNSLIVLRPSFISIRILLTLIIGMLLRHLPAFERVPALKLPSLPSVAYSRRI